LRFCSFQRSFVLPRKHHRLFPSSRRLETGAVFLLCLPLVILLVVLFLPLNLQFQSSSHTNTHRSASHLRHSSFWAIFRGCRRKRDRTSSPSIYISSLSHAPQSYPSAAAALCQSLFKVVICLCYSCKAHSLLSIKFHALFRSLLSISESSSALLIVRVTQDRKASAHQPKEKAFIIFQLSACFIEFYQHTLHHQSSCF
jgi:hypothetical protein